MKENFWNKYIKGNSSYENYRQLFASLLFYSGEIHGFTSLMFTHRRSTAEYAENDGDTLGDSLQMCLRVTGR